MVVQHNIIAQNALRNLTVNRGKLNGNLEKLSTGFRINRAADDAAGLAVSEKMRAQITGLEGAKRNAKDGIGLIQTAEGALAEVHDMLNRMYSLAEQSANGTYQDSNDRASLEMEAEALNREIDRIGATANFNGTILFGDNGRTANMLNGGVTFAIGEDGRADNQMNLFEDSDWKNSAIMDGIFGAGVRPANITAAELKIQAGIVPSGDGISLMTSTYAQDALENIKDAINMISAIRGRLGGYQNRLEHTINNLGVTTENIQQAESVIRDTDVAEEMMKYTKNNILSQSAQSLLAQANQQPEGALQILRGAQ